MEGFLKTINGISRFLNIIAGISLTFLMLLTITDVILRGFKSPVPGTYEVVAFAGAVVIGFSMPLTSWLRGHIFVDFFILKFSQKGRDIFNIATRCRGDSIIFPDRLEPDQICNGSAKIRRGLPYLTNAVLPSRLWSGSMLFCPVLSTGMRYCEDIRREIR